MTFLSELEKGNLMASKCTNCKKYVWPICEFCNHCFEKTDLVKISNNGKLLEYSVKDDKVFGLVEFEEGIRILGKISFSGKKLTEGDSVKFDRGWESEGNYHFEMSVV